jgi:phosphoserine phosphatase RsbU/P
MRTYATKLPYLLLALLLAGSCLFYAASTAASFDTFLNKDRARPPLRYLHTARFLIQPLPESERAGLHPGDEVLSINGVPFTGMAGIIRQAFYAHPGEIAKIIYRNSTGGTHTAWVKWMPRRAGVPNFTGWLINLLLVLIFPAFCLVLGFWVVLARPRDWNAWFLLGIMNAVPSFITQTTGYYPGFLTPFTIFWQIFSIQWMLVSLILFSIYFPVRSQTDVRYPWIKWLLIIPEILLVPAFCILEYGRLYDHHFVRPYLVAIDPLSVALNIFAAISLCLFIAAIVGKLFAVPAPAPDARRRLAVVAVGSLLGLGPVIVLIVISTLSDKKRHLPGRFSRLRFCLRFFLCRWPTR